MTDKTRPISSSNPPESKGIRRTNPAEPAKKDTTLRLPPANVKEEKKEEKKSKTAK